MATYLDPKNDLTFKRIFGEHPDLLISFLNALMPFDDGQIITEVEYLLPEQVPDNPLKRNSIVDVKCKDNHNRIFIVEMQMLWDESFNNRLVFNAGKAYVRQLDRKEDFSLLKPVYSLAILNENFEHKTEKFYHHYRIANCANTDEVIQGLEFILVELKKFVPQTLAERKMTVLWLRFLKEVGEDMRLLPKEMQENDLIYKASELCREGALTDGEIEAYDKYWDIIRTEKTLLYSAEKRGKAEGIIAVATKLKARGVPFEQISEDTGLSIEQIEKL